MVCFKTNENTLLMFDIRIFHHRHACICFHLLFFSKNFVLVIFHDNADQRNIVIVLIRVSYIIYTLKTLNR